MRQIKQIDIRERNLKNVYEYVLHNSNVSRAKVAKALELSRPSSSSLVDELFLRTEKKKKMAVWEEIQY